MKLPISVVIPCRNQCKFLESAVDSATEAGAAEVLIYDDASKDRTHQVATSLQWRERNIRLFTSSFVTGVCFARNFLIDHADNELIVCLDADDMLYPDALRRLYDTWQPGSWCYGGYTEMNEFGSKLADVAAPPPGMLYRKNITHATFLFAKEDWKVIGGFDPDFELAAEDYAFQVALTAHSIKPVPVPGAPIYWRTIHDSSRTSRAVEHFPMLHNLIRQKWPSAFPTITRFT